MFYIILCILFFLILFSRRFFKKERKIPLTLSINGEETKMYFTKKEWFRICNAAIQESKRVDRYIKDKMEEVKNEL